MDDDVDKAFDEKLLELLAALNANHAPKYQEIEAAAIRNLAEARAWYLAPGQPHGGATDTSG